MEFMHDSRGDFQPKFTFLTKKYFVSLIVIIVIACLFVLLYILSPKKNSIVTTTTPPKVQSLESHEVIGYSVQHRTLDEYTLINPAASTTDISKLKNVLFVGGMHGGYEWNASLVAYEIKKYFELHPESIPENISITIIPDINPDGTFQVVGKEGEFSLSDIPDTKKFPHGFGRLNADDVDLNRNFACHWQPKSMWQNKPVSAGTAAFSEPEARALRDYIVKTKPVSVAFWHSQSGTVYGSECDNGVLPETVNVMNAYAHAAGYNAEKAFTAYKVTGDSEGYLASQGIPAITVELTTHDSPETEKNLAGTKAVLQYFGSH
jgi:predicted deacylase